MRNEIRYPIFAALLVIVGMFAGYKLHQGTAGLQLKRVAKDVDKFSQALRYVEENYVDVPEHNKLMNDAITGMLAGLDPHSFYIPPVENQAMEEQMEGSFEGIGVEFNILNDTLYVVAPISGGPSEMAGIQSGDRIVKIEEENIAGIGLTNIDVMKKLKGKKGTKVKLQILRRGTQRPLIFDITRDKIPIHSVDFSYMIRDEIGYLKIGNFARTTHEEFQQHLRALQNQGMKKLILDLRDNPGGYMDQAQLIADEFIGKGKLVVYTEGRSLESNTRYDATSRFKMFEEGALVVLMNYGSASASEIVAGAVQDWDRGLIVGLRSFGKGLVQTQENFEDGSAMRIVVSKYYTPSGRCIQKPYHMRAEDYESEILHRFETGEIYDSTKMDIPDSLTFKTKGGRTVYGGGGIIPDVFIARDTSFDTDLIQEYTALGVIRQFTWEHPDLENIRSRYKNSEEFVARFEVDANMLLSLKTFAASRVSDQSEKSFQQSLPLIKNLVKANFGRRLFKEEGFFPVMHQMDNVLQSSIPQLKAAEELQKLKK